MTKRENIKRWVKDHSETLTVVGFVTGVSALYAGFVVLAYKEAEQNEKNEQALRDEIVEKSAAGWTILPNTDGSFWTIPPKG